MNCPLCHKTGAELFHRDSIRDFFRCSGCTIIFVPRSAILSAADEKHRYDSHQNNETDPRYRDYFLKTVGPVMEQISAGARGLDLGSGRTRLMEKLFREGGHEMDSYDPFYFPDESIWEKTYDFVVMNEVIEHLHDPAGTMKRIGTICRGPLFIHTRIYPETPEQFAKWYYMRDPTHVQFFSMEAFQFLGKTEKIAADLYKIELK